MRGIDQANYDREVRPAQTAPRPVARPAAVQQ